MRKQLLQVFLERSPWFVGGFIFLGSIYDSFVNSITLWNLRLAQYLTASLFIIVLVFIVLFRLRIVKWVTKDGQTVTIKSFGRKIISFCIGALFLLWFPGVLNAVSFTPLTSEKKFIPAFDSSDKKFHVMILPFNEDCYYDGIKHEVGNVIFRRLNDLNLENDLDLSIKYVDTSIVSSDLDMPYKLMKAHNADFIVYGYYSLKECEGGDSNKICYNYQVDSSQFKNGIFHPDKFIKPIGISGLASIRHGYGQEKIDDILYFLAGVSAYHRGKWEKTIELISKVSRSKTDKLLAQIIAVSYGSLGNHQEAIKILEEYLKRDSEAFDLWEGLGRNYMILNLLEKAKKCFETCLKYSPDNVSALHNLGHVYEMLNDASNAEVNYLKAFRLDKKDRILLKELGEFYEKLNSPSFNTYIIMREAIDADSLNDVAWAGLGITYRKMNNLVYAEKSLFRSLSIDSCNALAYLNLGLMRSEQSQFDDAQYFFNKALSVNTNSTVAYIEIGKILRAKGNFDSAIYYYKKCLSIDSTSVPALAEIGMCYLNKLKLSDAKKFTLLAIKLEAQNASSLYNLSVIYCLEGDKKKSLYHLKKAIEIDNKIKSRVRFDPGFHSLLNDKDFLKIIT